MSKIADKFRSIADNLQTQIDAKRDPAIRQQNLTPRRARIAQGMAQDANRLEQIQTLLRMLAHAHDNPMTGWVAWPATQREALQNIKSKADIERLPYGALEKLVGPTEERPEQKLRRMEEELLGTKIPGFFPTPAETVDQLVELADLRPGLRVLEPSAGKGDIADGIHRYMKEFYDSDAQDGVQLRCVEVISRLADICRTKGHLCDNLDILTLTTSQQFDRIIMNPPFEKGQDMAHVMHCFNNLLAPGGILVSIVSEAPFFRDGAKFDDFRSFLSDNQTQEPIKLASAFEGAQSFRQTGVNTRIVVLKKDPAWQQTSSRNSLKTSETQTPI
jgi:SAM-dependent methyltransferase